MTGDMRKVIVTLPVSLFSLGIVWPNYYWQNISLIGINKDILNEKGHEEDCSDFTDVTFCQYGWPNCYWQKTSSLTGDMRKVAVTLMMSLLSILMTQLLLTKGVLNDRGHEESCSDFKKVTLANMDDPIDTDQRRFHWQGTWGRLQWLEWCHSCQYGWPSWNWPKTSSMTVDMRKDAVTLLMSLLSIDTDQRRPQWWVT